MSPVQCDASLNHLWLLLLALPGWSLSSLTHGLWDSCFLKTGAAWWPNMCPLSCSVKKCQNYPENSAAFLQKERKVSFLEHDSLVTVFDCWRLGWMTAIFPRPPRAHVVVLNTVPWRFFIQDHRRAWRLHTFNKGFSQIDISLQALNIFNIFAVGPERPGLFTFSIQLNNNVYVLIICWCWA